MIHVKSVFLIALAAGVLAACAGQSDGNGSASTAESPSPASEPSPEATHYVPPPPPELAGLKERLVVPATANIFGAGHEVAPDPGGGGGGTLPPGWRLPDGSGRIVTFPNVTGRVNFWTGTDDWNGPAGDDDYNTDVESLEGIAGIIHEKGSFLVGVFLGEEEPADPAPARLDFTKPPPGDLIEPEIGQVFLIGDGKDYRFAVPDEATRLFLGSADAMLWEGNPGWYGNNSGEFKATADLTEG